jgi:uncharacterized repeat protein (TIGR03803 family)
LRPLGRLPATNRLNLAIGLPLRNTNALDKLLQDIYDPASPRFRRYLTPEQFTEQFGPAQQDYDAVRQFAKSQGLDITVTHPNRVLLDVAGQVADIEKAFRVTLHRYKHPREARQFFAPEVEPSVEAGLAVLDISGLNNYARPRPLFHGNGAPGGSPPGSGSGPNGNYMGKDFRNAYAPGVTLTGAGQMVGLLEFEGFYAGDITTYETVAGLPNVPIQVVLLDGFNGIPVTTDPGGIDEVSFDIEMAISMAPGLSKVVVFNAGPPGVPNDVLNATAANPQIKQFSSSWIVWGSPSGTTDNIFKQMALQGESFFQVSGDGDSWVNSPLIAPWGAEGFWPADDPYVTSVGGTSLTMNGSGAFYASERVWNDGNTPPGWDGSGYLGSGGGISVSYPIPSWQKGLDMSANRGSTTKRNFPDVAIVAENFVIVANGSTFTGLVGGPLNPGALSYSLTNRNGSLGWSLALDAAWLSVSPTNGTLLRGGPAAVITVTPNLLATNLAAGSYTATLFFTNLLDQSVQTRHISLAIVSLPLITSQPTNQPVLEGMTATFSVGTASNALLCYQWQFDSGTGPTNLTDGGAISGSATSALTINNASPANAGAYSVIVSNAAGSVTSATTSLTIITGQAPVIVSAPATQTLLPGATATFTVSAAGDQPFSYFWQMNETNLATGGSISGSAARPLAHGTVFKLAAYGSLTGIHSFDYEDGAYPSSTLVQGGDGNLYSTTSQGGIGGQGTVFQITTNGRLTTLVWFNGTNGANPQGALIQARDGSFYGTAEFGRTGYNGASGSGDGFVFRLTLPLFLSNPFTQASGTATAPYSASLSTNAVTPAGDVLTFAKVSGPAWLSVAPDGTLSGTPALGDIGGNMFVVSLADTNGWASAATMSISVVPLPSISLSTQGTNIVLSWSGGQPAYSVQMATDLAGPAWQTIAGPMTNTTLLVAPTNRAAFYRVGVGN